MEMCGQHFVNYVARKLDDHEALLSVLGRHLRDFLNGLDNLHDYLRFSYPRMAAPSFFCQSETANGLVLRYRSRRRGYVPYVVGQIREVARLYYDTSLDVEVLSTEDGPETANDETASGSSPDRERLSYALRK